MLKRLWFRFRGRGNSRRFATTSSCRPRNRSNVDIVIVDVDDNPLDTAIASVADAASGDKPPSQPLPHPAYEPVRVEPVLDLPFHYWFHVYLNSYDCDRLLAPFVKSLVEDIPKDRRLLSIMNRCQVRVAMGELELYKSLPRYVFILHGANWDSIIRALVELELAFPELLRFASHPLLVDTPTQRFSTSFWRQTALQTRITR